jgi:hypothetical protein
MELNLVNKLHFFKFFINSVLILLMVMSEFSWATILPVDNPIRRKYDTSYIHFGGHVGPNEWNTQAAIPIWEKAISGLYIAVGTERGFIGASVCPSISHLVLVDRHPDVVLFNRLNTFF